MNDVDTSKPRVLWAGPNPPEVPASAEFALHCEPDATIAARLAQTEPFDVVIAASVAPEALAAVLTAAKGNRRAGRRWAACNYAQVPELVRTVDAGLIERLLAKPVSLEHLITAVTDPDPSASVIWRRALNAPADLSARGVDQRLTEFVDRLVQMPTAVIRPIASKDELPRLQIVVPISDSLSELRRSLPTALGWPLKASGSAMGSGYRAHPIRRIVGNLSEPQEVYCLGREDFAYVAFFPWHDDLKVTVVVGYQRPGSGRIAALHARAVSHAREFPLPTPRRHATDVFYDPDYDWVITQNYVGPDRRRKSTSFISRYTFRGRRKALMPNEFSGVGTFVDVAPRWVGMAAVAFAALFLVDTTMTAYYVGGGQVAELNPVMRWTIDRSPVLFWAFKSALVIATIFIVMRWHLWKPGRWLFAASVAIYGVLDLYWLLLYATRSVG